MDTLVHLLLNVTLFPLGVIALITILPGLWFFRFIWKTLFKKERRVRGKTVIITGASSGIGEVSVVRPEVQPPCLSTCDWQSRLFFKIGQE